MKKLIAKVNISYPLRQKKSIRQLNEHLFSVLTSIDTFLNYYAYNNKALNISSLMTGCHIILPDYSEVFNRYIRPRAIILYFANLNSLVLFR